MKKLPPELPIPFEWFTNNEFIKQAWVIASKGEKVF